MIDQIREPYKFSLLIKSGTLTNIARNRSPCLYPSRSSRSIYVYNEHKSRAKVEAIPKACGSGRRSELNLNIPLVLCVAESTHAHIQLSSLTGFHWERGSFAFNSMRRNKAKGSSDSGDGSRQHPFRTWLNKQQDSVTTDTATNDNGVQFFHSGNRKSR